MLPSKVLVPYYLVCRARCNYLLFHNFLRATNVIFAIHESLENVNLILSQLSQNLAIAIRFRCFSQTSLVSSLV